MADSQPNVVRERLQELLASYPHLTERIHRHIMVELHKRGITDVDTIHDRARAEAGRPPEQGSLDHNQPERERWDEIERAYVEAMVRDLACEHFKVDEITDIVHLTLKQEEVHSLESVATLASVTFGQLNEKLERFAELPTGETKLHPAEVIGTRVALIRHFFSDQLEFIGIAKNYTRIRDFAELARHIVGSESAMGKVGGKAGGMILANCILREKNEQKRSALIEAGEPDQKLDTEAYMPLATPESYFLRSDVVEEFLRLNRLGEYQNQKYKDIDAVSREYPLIRGVFRNGDFPLEIVQRLRAILSKIGTHPLIVRSSSLLEDRFGAAFSGKYQSIFLANQGTLEERLRALLGAIAEVYASIMAPDPIIYRREHKLIDYVEEMAVLIQKVVGVRVGDYFFPPFAGVAFSRNEYRWSPRIKREDGLMRIVMGLGTRAVDRVGSDYPRMVALGAPTLRPAANIEDILRNSQQTVDVINIRRNKLESVRLSDILKDDAEIPMLDRLVSLHKEGTIYSPTGLLFNESPENLVITLEKLIATEKLPRQMKAILDTLENAYGIPVDLEFASNGESLYVLQCRPLAQATDTGPVDVPEDVPDERVLFEANRFVRSGLIENIEYVVYVVPDVFFNIESPAHRVQLARVIGRVNHKLRRRSFILVGPGRWGSSDVRLGVPVRYADINNCSMLVEVARDRGGFTPEVSFGTHFFQDLVEADINYLPLYPDTPNLRYNEELLLNAENRLAEVSPDDAEFQNEVRVVNMPASTNGGKLTIAMSGDEDRALAYVK